MKLTMERFNTLLARAQENTSNLSQDRLDKLDEAMNLDFEEHFKFQGLKSEFHANGMFDDEVALFIYASLGALHSEYNGGWADRVPTVTKCLLTQLFGEMIEIKIKKAS